MSKVKDYFDAWLNLRREQTVVRVKLDVDWIEVAVGVVAALWFYQEFVK